MGDPNVGKTTLIQRFLTNNLPEIPKATVGALEHHRTLYLNKSMKDLKLALWDIAGGQGPVSDLTSMYYRDADACIMVFDVTERETYHNLKAQWIEAVREKAPDGVVIVIVGNKCE